MDLRIGLIWLPIIPQSFLWFVRKRIKICEGHIRMEVEMVLLDGDLLLWYIHNYEAEVISGCSLQGQEESLHRLPSRYPGWREIRHG